MYSAIINKNIQSLFEEILKLTKKIKPKQYLISKLSKSKIFWLNHQSTQSHNKMKTSWVIPIFKQGEKSDVLILILNWLHQSQV